MRKFIAEFRAAQKKAQDEGNAFTKELMAARERGDKTFTVAGKTYKTENYKHVKEEKDDFEPHMMYDPKTGKGYKANKPEDHERMKKMGYTHDDPNTKAKEEDASNDKSDDGEGMDKVDPKAVKKKFADRKDKDIDNDGDVDSSDKYLHRRRKAISKAGDKEDEPKKNGGEEDVKMNPKKETKEAVHDKHTMDPTSHVTQDKKTGMFCVYNINGKKVAEFKTKPEADAYAKKNHDDLMKKESTIRDRLLSVWEAAQPNQSGAKAEPQHKEDEGGMSKKMKDDHKKGETDDTHAKGLDDAAKAGRAGPNGKARDNDSKIGDKQVINKIVAAYKGMKNGD